MTSSNDLVPMPRSGLPIAHMRSVFRPDDVERRLDATARRLLRAGEGIALPPKVFELLLLLARNAGRAVPKEELIEAHRAREALEKLRER